MQHWLRSPSHIPSAFTQNFIIGLVCMLPIPMTASLLESMHQAATAASQTPLLSTCKKTDEAADVHGWDTMEGVEQAVASARRGSTGGKVSACLCYCAIAFTDLLYYLPSLHTLFSFFWLATTLLVSLMFVMVLSYSYRSLRMGLVRRERQNTAAYVSSRVPTVAAILAMQCLTSLYVLRVTSYLPMTPTATDVYLDDHIHGMCKDIDHTYLTTFCNLTVQVGPWNGLIHDWRTNIAVGWEGVGGAVWICDDPWPVHVGPFGDIIYTSRLSACKASSIINLAFGLMISALPFNLLLLLCIAFRETLMSVDANITWQNFTSRGGRRTKAAVLLALLGTLFLPFFLIQLLVGPNGMRFFVDGYLTIGQLTLFILIWCVAFLLLAIEFYTARYSDSGDMNLLDGSSLRETLVDLVKGLAVDLRAGTSNPLSAHSKLSGDVRQLTLGQAEHAALGVNIYMKFAGAMPSIDRGVQCIENEFQTALDKARTAVDEAGKVPDSELASVRKAIQTAHPNCGSDKALSEQLAFAREALQKAHPDWDSGIVRERLCDQWTIAKGGVDWKKVQGFFDAESDFECLQYVRYERAGTNNKIFSNGHLKRDCDDQGNVLETRLNKDGHGMNLDEFCNEAPAKMSKLKTPHVLALRLYTTAAFARLNTPLRDQDPAAAPHPFPVTINYIKEGISQLRAVGFKGGGLVKSDFWRGMRNVEIEKDKVESILRDGGTVRAANVASSPVHCKRRPMLMVRGCAAGTRTHEHHC